MLAQARPVSLCWGGAHTPPERAPSPGLAGGQAVCVEIAPRNRVQPEPSWPEDSGAAAPGSALWGSPGSSLPSPMDGTRGAQGITWGAWPGRQQGWPPHTAAGT